jgi:hypothetical protein
MAWLPQSHYDNFAGMWPLLVLCETDSTGPVEVADQAATEAWLDEHSLTVHGGATDFTFQVYKLEPPGEDPPPEEEG